MGTQHKDTALAYLKVVIHLLNENMDELEFKLGRPMRLEDLDNLTSSQMMNIVTFLLRDVVGDKPIYKTTTLEEFNKFGIGTVSYDCGMDHIYHAVKQIFPEDSDLFNYSVLLFPSSNPKRTKAVISYIMSFVLMCDNLEERFNTCYEEIIKENDEKLAICREIDDLKDTISAKIQEKETEKERIPILHKELQTLEETIRKQQRVLAKLNAEVEKHKTVYENCEKETKNLELKLEQINLDKLNMEQQIVLNPNEIRAENDSIKKQLEAERKTRETIGAQLEKSSKECDEFDSLIQHAHHVIQSIKSVTALMENTKLKIELYTKTGNEMKASSRELEQITLGLRKLKEKHTQDVAEITRRKDDQDLKLQELQNEMLKTQKQILQTKVDIQSVTNDQYEVVRSIEEVSREIENLKKEIDDCAHSIGVVLPQQRKQQEAEAEKLLVQIAENFSHYPILKEEAKPDKNK